MIEVLDIYRNKRETIEQKAQKVLGMLKIKRLVEPLYIDKAGFGGALIDVLRHKGVHVEDALMRRI